MDRIYNEVGLMQESIAFDEAIEACRRDPDGRILARVACDAVTASVRNLVALELFRGQPWLIPQARTAALMVRPWKCVAFLDAGY
jgi:hypothetical protein